MKKKLKKLGVLAVVLLAGAFSQVGNAQEVISIGSGDNGDGNRVHKCYLVTFRGSYEINCGGKGIDCLVVADCPPTL